MQLVEPECQEMECESGTIHCFEEESIVKVFLLLIVCFLMDFVLGRNKTPFFIKKS